MWEPDEVRITTMDLLGALSTLEQLVREARFLARTGTGSGSDVQFRLSRLREHLAELANTQTLLNIERSLSERRPKRHTA